MSELNIEIRAILRHYWKDNFKQIVVAKKKCEVEGGETVETQMAQFWFHKQVG